MASLPGFVLFWLSWTCLALAVYLAISSFDERSEEYVRIVNKVLVITGVLGLVLYYPDKYLFWLHGLFVILLYLVWVALLMLLVVFSPVQILLFRHESVYRLEIDTGMVVQFEGRGDIIVDFVAVHGFGSDSKAIWIDRTSGAMWLKDFLPNAFPRSRIMTFEYDSAWNFDAPSKSLEDYGKQLLEHLIDSRQKGKEAERPIIFIGYSFGGIVIKQAMVLAAHQNHENKFQSLKNLVLGALFIGVPHGGSQLTTMGILWSYRTYWLGSSTETLKVLKLGSDTLWSLNDSFLAAYKKPVVLKCLFETRVEKIWGIPLALAVDKRSSTLPGMDFTAVDVKHTDMNKFASESDKKYQLVVGKLKEIYQSAEKIEQEKLKILDEEQRACLKTLFFEGFENLQSTIEPPHESTLQWVEALLQDWMNNKSNIVWISGKPGSGKSTLSGHIFRQMSKHKKPTGEVVAGFFFNDRGNTLLKSRSGFLRALVLQILQQIPALFYHIMPEYRAKRDRSQSPLVEWDDGSLRGILVSIIRDPKARLLSATRLVIDAFDECEASSREWLLNLLIELSQLPSPPQIFITSRPIGEMDEIMEPIIQNRPDSAITVRMEEMNPQDIRAYVESEFRSLVDGINKRWYTSNDIETLQNEVINRSQGVFLWVTLVVKELKRLKQGGATIKKLRQTLDEIPGDLDGLYERIFLGLDVEAYGDTWRMMAWAIFGEGPLSVTDFRYAITIDLPDNEFDSLDSIHESDDFVTESSQIVLQIRSTCGGFLEARETGSNTIVELIHQSAKEFLLKKEIWILPSKAHTHLARACIAYITLSTFVGIDSGLVKETPFLAYATINWPKHAVLATDATVPGGATQTMEFDWPRTRKFDTWRTNFNFLDVYSLSQQLPKTPLLVTARIGLLNDVKYYLGYPTDDKVLSETLRQASLGGCATVAQLLMDLGADVNFDGGYGNSLQAAAWYGHEALVRLFLDNHADVNHVGAKLGTALAAASLRGHYRVMKFLIDNGANVNLEGGVYGNALQAAALSNNKEAIQLLIDNDATVNLRGGGYGSPLKAAIAASSEDIIKLFIDNHADVNLNLPNRVSALDLAAQHGLYSVVGILIDKGADVNYEGGPHRSALKNAIAHDFKGSTSHGRMYEEIVRLLISKGANVNFSGGNSGTALQVASGKGNRKMMQLLIEHGADVNLEGGFHGSPLKQAAANADEETVEFLIGNGANANLKSTNGSALQAAAINGHENIVRILINKGAADVNLKCGDLSSALQSAVLGGHEKIVLLLIQNGADVNLKGGEYGSPLQAAAAAGHETILKLLIDNGADVNADGGDYGSALEAATAWRRENIVQLLVNSGARAGPLEDFAEA